MQGRIHRLPNGARLVVLLDEPATVDGRICAGVHARWLRAT
ncbi:MULTISPECIES: hypothetical protein [unclassified Actinoplanes]|nr:MULTISPECIES: hypothetical protein [unclassified Actinoplanes]